MAFQVKPFILLAALTAPCWGGHLIYISNQSPDPLEVVNETPAQPGEIVFVPHESPDLPVTVPQGEGRVIASGGTVAVDLVPVHAHQARFGLFQNGVRAGRIHYTVAMPEDEATVEKDPLDWDVLADAEIADGDILVYFGF